MNGLNKLKRNSMNLEEKFIIISYILGSIVGVFSWEMLLRKYFIKKK